MYHCSNCGYKSIKWLGKCPTCQAWESFVQEEAAQDTRITRERVPPQPLNSVELKDERRVVTGLNELDRILGGGMVRGEVIIVGGEPGVGKSTLLLEVASLVSGKDKTLYVSAEESAPQVALRFKRLGGDSNNLYIVGEDNLSVIASYVENEGFKFIVIDSIQVVYSPDYEGSKGSISQIRGCADYLTQLARATGAVIFIIGHVTKEGAIAGPKLLEHIVDCVLYFEGEVLSNYRILRASKNRFGSTGDIAVFEMTSMGLKEVKKISDVFLPHKLEALSGSCVSCVIEGVRPLPVEMQALVCRASFSIVRRRSLGFDFNRFALLVAIIEKRLKISLSSEDVFLNVAGGLRVSDPAADLAVVCAVVSSLREKKAPGKCVFIGEVGLGGELRHVSNINLRLKEIARINFEQCFIPKANLEEVDRAFDLRIQGLGSLKEVVERVFK